MIARRYIAPCAECLVGSIRYSIIYLIARLVEALLRTYRRDLYGKGNKRYLLVRLKQFQEPWNRISGCKHLSVFLACTHWIFLVAF